MMNWAADKDFVTHALDFALGTYAKNALDLIFGRCCPLTHNALGGVLTRMGGWWGFAELFQQTSG